MAILCLQLVALVGKRAIQCHFSGLETTSQTLTLLDDGGPNLQSKKHQRLTSWE